MLKLIKSVTRNVNISIFQNEKGEFWSVEQDLNSSNYVVSQCDANDIKVTSLDPILSTNLPKAGENPHVYVFEKGDSELVPEKVIESIFGPDKK